MERVAALVARKPPPVCARTKNASDAVRLRRLKTQRMLLSLQLLYLGTRRLHFRDYFFLSFFGFPLFSAPCFRGSTSFVGERCASPAVSLLLPLSLRVLCVIPPRPQPHSYFLNEYTVR